MKVPERYRPALVELRALPADVVTRLENALAGTSLHVDADQIPRNVANAIDSGQNIERIVEALVSLYMFRSYAEATLDETIQGVVNELVAQDGVQMGPTQSEELNERLRRLLGVERLQTALKANSLSNDHQHTFSFAKIISDVRPVFSVDLSQPACAVIIHTLAVHYFEDGEYKQFRVAVDADDLKSLRSVIERAEQKASALKQVMARADVSCEETSVE